MILKDSNIRITLRRQSKPDRFIAHLQDDKGAFQFEVIIDADEHYCLSILLQTLEERIKEWVTPKGVV